MQDVKVSEFVLSNELVSMALAMVSENRDVNVIQNELFTDNGNELYLMPASKYLRLVKSCIFPPWRFLLKHVSMVLQVEGDSVDAGLSAQKKASSCHYYISGPEMQKRMHRSAQLARHKQSSRLTHAFAPTLELILKLLTAAAESTIHCSLLLRCVFVSQLMRSDLHVACIAISVQT